MSFVYFVWCEGFVKIGRTLDIKERLSDLRTGNPFPITVLGVIEGTKKLESQLHKKYRNQKVHGEWFNLTEDQLRELQDSFVIDRGNYLVQDGKPEIGDFVKVSKGEHLGVVGLLDEIEDDHGVVIPFCRTDLDEVWVPFERLNKVQTRGR